jgi:hypothetical protein
MTGLRTPTLTIRLGVISDAHVAPPGSPPYAWHAPYRLEDSLERLARAVDRCVARDADALLLPGDVTQGGDAWAIGEVIEVLARSERPAWIAGGNHDTRGGSGTDGSLLPGALAAVRDGPVRGVDPIGVTVGPATLAGTHARPADDGRYEGDPPAESDTPGPRVWLTHFPVLPGEARLAAAGLRHPGDARDRAEVAARLSGLPGPTLVLSGHLHVRDATTEGAVLQLGAAALVEPPFEIGMVDIAVDGQEVLVSRSCESVEGWDGPAPLLAPAVQAWRYRPGSGWQPIAPVT